MTTVVRTTGALGYLLHATPYSESSLVVEIFTREFGRVAAVAKGARRPRSALRPVLLQFQPLSVSYSGRAELRTLTGVEWLGGVNAPRGEALLCAFYLNELLVKLLAREDAHPGLFDAYAQSLREMDAGVALDETLRRFEWTLLRETGYAPDLSCDTSRRPIEASRTYSWQPGAGFAPVAMDSGARTTVHGSTLRDIATGDYAAPGSRQEAKYLMRAIVGHHLDGGVLHSRQILVDLQRL